MRYFVLHDRAFFFPIFCLCLFIFAVNRDEDIVRESFAVKYTIYVHCR
jgi:hypothetical protein